MLTPDLGEHRVLVHKILDYSRNLLEANNDSCPPMARLLRSATDYICDQQVGRVSPHHAAWLEAEAAAHLITAAGWHTTGLTDPTLPQQLTLLDHHPRVDRLRLVNIAADLSNPERPARPRTVRIPAPRTPTPPSPRTSGNPGRPDRHRTKSCKCACNQEDACGGCGHDGCAGH
ncbi:hypothetical protein V1460_06200 [Streptomyces sp. SCSIO 30461]|uniref:hypothetical protein n=1 Tax=Streptomyces sp. SCSIO 30461 TaxID=3118085 RepID=UPI0030D184FE